MKHLELPPTVNSEDLLQAVLTPPSQEIKAIVEKINEDYAYWDTVKYKSRPQNCSAEQLWKYVKASRQKNKLCVWDKYGVTLSLTSRMQRMCHQFDMNFGGSWGTDAILSNEKKEKYLLSSLMEEAIFSSQMEGAATTREVAKDMLRNKLTPKDKSQQMIANNYQTIQFITEHKDTPLTTELLQHVHLLMTEKTLDAPENAGMFRTNDEVIVEDGITHEIVHRPPSFTEIPQFVEELCAFFNEKEPAVFIHPVIRGIIIHFMVAYMHPFVDGNGRTARALFYWYMLKQKYWLTEYLSISRVIAKSKKSYEKSFLYTEHDNNDIGYFVTYNLDVLDKSFKQLQAYLQRKQEEKDRANAFLVLGDINERQSEIIRMLSENPSEVFTVRDLQNKFLVSATTAKSDIMGLVERGFVSEFAFNKVKRGYIRSKEFEKTLQPYLTEFFPDR